ncbi:hypothetical protein ACP8HI_09610 [Paenibacillus sp. FA6]|uniref:hypothetical protein n=1 Tax=Paenibacillus sp. FA6 TaxID=3413029 RepID=UPI003F657E55
MRRYWLSILLSVFIVVGMSTYYVFGAADHLPEYKLSIVEGDITEGAKIQVIGSYIGSYIGGKGSGVLSVTTDGSDYQSRHSIYRKEFSNTERSVMTQAPDIRQITKDHRSFMRGKGSADSLYKDEEWIIYAEAYANNTDDDKSGIVLSIELLNQTTDKVSHYETFVNEQTSYAYSYVMDVQLIEDEIHILTYQRPARIEGKMIVDMSDSDEYHNYVVDMNNGVLMNKEILNFGITAKDNVELHQNIITNATYSASSDHTLFKVREMKRTTIDEERSREVVGNHFYSYKYKTGKLTDLSDILEAVGMADDVSYRLNGSNLSILNSEPDMITISNYNLDTGKMENKVVTLTSEQLGADTLGNGILKNDRIYILFYKNDIPMTAVVDASNGDIVYKGEVVFDGAASESKEHMMNVQLLNIGITE